LTFVAFLINAACIGAFMRVFVPFVGGDRNVYLLTEMRDEPRLGGVGVARSFARASTHGWAVVRVLLDKRGRGGGMVSAG
jgi:hypothetical protein